MLAFWIMQDPERSCRFMQHQYVDSQETRKNAEVTCGSAMAIVGDLKMGLEESERERNRFKKEK